VTKSLEDYVEAVYVLIVKCGAAHVRDVAQELNVKMPSVVKAISELKKMGFVTQAPYGDIKLTPKGEDIAREILSRHKVLHRFLMSIGVSEETADKDACLMEHILSAETMDRIEVFLAEKNNSGILTSKCINSKRRKIKNESNNE
jgi:DtxR family Mn-dependent transcriptional regulator